MQYISNETFRFTNRKSPNNVSPCLKQALIQSAQLFFIPRKNLNKVQRLPFCRNWMKRDFFHPNLSKLLRAFKDLLLIRRWESYIHLCFSVGFSSKFKKFYQRKCLTILFKVEQWQRVIYNHFIPYL